MKVIAILVIGNLLGASTQESLAAQRKFDAIEYGRMQPGATVTLTSAELNSWMQEEAKSIAGDSVRKLRLELGEGRASGYASIDFLKLKQRTGETPGFLLRQLLAGERPVALTVRFLSRNGRAKVDVERIEISGIPLEGAALDFLIQTYLHATFPEAKIGEWFLLDKHVDHFAAHARGVDVLVRDPRAQIASK